MLSFFFFFRTGFQVRPKEARRAEGGKGHQAFPAGKTPAVDWCFALQGSEPCPLVADQGRNKFKTLRKISTPRCAASGLGLLTLKSKSEEWNKEEVSKSPHSLSHPCLTLNISAAIKSTNTASAWCWRCKEHVCRHLKRFAQPCGCTDLQICAWTHNSLVMGMLSCGGTPRRA